MARLTHLPSSEEIARICRQYRIRELSVFGSALRDDFTPESDIDLLVEFDESASIGFMELGELELAFEQLFGRPIDLVPKRAVRPILRHEIVTTAKLLYAAA